VANLVGDLRLDSRLAAQLRLRTYPAGPASSGARDARLSPDLRARRPPAGAPDRATITDAQLDFYQLAALAFLLNLDGDTTVFDALVRAVRRTVEQQRDAAWELRASANLAHYLAVCSDAVAHHARAASEPDLAAGASWVGGVLRCELVVLTTDMVAQAAGGGVDAGRVLARIAWNRDCLEWMGQLSRFDPLAPRLLEALAGYPQPRAHGAAGAAAEQVEQADSQVEKWRLSVQGQP